MYVLYVLMSNGYILVSIPKLSEISAVKINNLPC